VDGADAIDHALSSAALVKHVSNLVVSRSFLRRHSAKTAILLDPVIYAGSTDGRIS
jgi:hypothetical protein